MRITLTCVCGQKQYASPEMAGQTLACVHCGQVLTVPAMGKLQSGKRQTTAMPKSSSSSLTGVAAIGVGFVFLLSASGLLVWALTRETPAETKQLAEHKDPSAESPQRRRGDAEKKEVPPDSPKDSRLPVIDPVTPKSDPTPVVVDPVTPKVELPKPKDSPPTVEKKPENVIEPLRLVWKLKQEDVFYQELIVTQTPTFKVQGFPPIASQLQYRIVSRFTVTKRNEDGSLVVEQKIESAKLLKADELSQQTVAAAVGKMPGTTYKLELSPKMDVTKFEGGTAAMQLGGGLLGGGMGMQMASLIDRDGWKELNQSTFFQMSEPLKVNARWSKPLAHSWGALGSWHGQTHYLYGGQEKDLHKITYGLQLAYKAPKGGAIGLMTINGANFQAPTAGGVLLFDAARGRVVAAEERFRVKGVISVNLLGQNTGIEIDEDQHFLIRIHDVLEKPK